MHLTGREFLEKKMSIKIVKIPLTNLNVWHFCACHCILLQIYNSGLFFLCFYIFFFSFPLLLGVLLLCASTLLFLLIFFASFAICVWYFCSCLSLTFYISSFVWHLPRQGNVSPYIFPNIKSWLRRFLIFFIYMVLAMLHLFYFILIWFCFFIKPCMILLFLSMHASTNLHLYFFLISWCFLRLSIFLSCLRMLLRL